MIEATSCGGVVIYRGKILTLYKSYRNRYEGWVLPKGTVEKGETYEETALREVREEAGVRASIVKYIGKSQYNFSVPEDYVTKEVHWYLMTADNYHSKPQREEYFIDSGYYKYHEIYHLLRFSNGKTDCGKGISGISGSAEQRPVGEAAQVLSFCDREREAVFLHSLCVAEYGTKNMPGRILRVQ